MFGGGSIAAMVQSVRNNRNLLNNKFRNSFEQDKTKTNWLHKKLNYKQVSPRQTELFLQKLKAEKTREKRIRILVWIIGAVLIGIVFYLITT